MSGIDDILSRAWGVRDAAGGGAGKFRAAAPTFGFTFSAGRQAASARESERACGLPAHAPDARCVFRMARRQLWVLGQLEVRKVEAGSDGAAEQTMG